MPSTEVRKMTQRAQFNARDRGRVSVGRNFWLAVSLSVVSGVSAATFGIIYAFDFIAIALTIVSLGEYLKGRRVHLPYLVTGAALIVVAFVYAVFDRINGIAGVDMARGLARNAILGLSVIAWGWIFSSYSLGRSLLLLSISFGSPAIAIALDIGVSPMLAASGTVAFFKYHGGVGFLLAGILLLRSSLLACLLYSCASALVLLVVADYRSGALLFIGAAAAVGFLRILSRIPNWALVVGGLVLVVPGYFQTKQVLLDEQLFETHIVERRLASDEQRSDMIKFAWMEFLEQPLVGYGSWQNAARYGGANQSGQYISVHSMILLYLYEYGILGGFVPALVVITILLAMPAAFAQGRRGVPGVAVIIVYMLAVQSVNVVAGGLNGYARNTVGAVIALAIHCWSVERFARGRP